VQNLEYHPCFSQSAHSRYGRIHLPVARLCNLGCRYCERDAGGRSYHSYRPAVCDRLVSPGEVLELVEKFSRDQRLRVIGIAGPGEPLFNPETFETLELVGSAFPGRMLCLSTNGLLLSRHAETLNRLGVSTITVTINTLRPGTAVRIYRYAIVGQKLIRGPEAGEILVSRQIEGVRSAAALGMGVKINTILMPGVNQGEIGEIARLSKMAGARIQNITPLIPMGSMGDFPAPTCQELSEAREVGSNHLDQFRLCRQCRSDSVGIPGVGDGVLTRR